MPSAVRRKAASCCAAALALTPAWAQAATGSSIVAGILMLPFMLALGIALHVVISRIAKTVAASASPLATGELEVGGYQRRVYGTVDRAMLEVVAVVLLSGVAALSSVPQCIAHASKSAALPRLTSPKRPSMPAQMRSALSLRKSRRDESRSTPRRRFSR